ncbi:MAG: hypothetical protein HQ485_14160 [Acidobacteria bacterium]|nr:hypothetical protein [Acidobacteriota bacterium]
MLDKKSADVGSLTSNSIVVNLGKKSKKAIKKLKKGSGKMFVELQAAMDEVRARLPEADKQKTLVPVVMFCERKARKISKTPFSPFSMFK